MAGDSHSKIATGKRNNGLSLRVKLSQLSWPLPTPPRPPRTLHPKNQLRRQKRSTNANSAIVLSAEASTAVGTSDRVSHKIFVVAWGRRLPPGMAGSCGFSHS